MNSADGECPFLCPSSSFCTCFHMFSRSKDLDPLLDTLVLRKGKGIHKADLIQARGEALEAVYQLKRVIGEAIPSFNFYHFISGRGAFGRVYDAHERKSGQAVVCKARWKAA